MEIGGGGGSKALDLVKDDGGKDEAVLVAVEDEVALVAAA